MYDKKLHITPSPDTGFPKPEIPADEAWNNMSELLGVEMPVSQADPPSSAQPPSSGVGGILGGSGHFWSIVLIVLSAAGILTWVVLHSTNKPEAPAKSANAIKSIQDTKVPDSLASIHQGNSSSANKIQPDVAFESYNSKRDLNLIRSNSGQATGNSRQVNKANYIQDPILTNPPPFNLPVLNDTTIAPSQPVTDNKIPSGDVVIKQPTAIENTSQDTISANGLQPPTHSTDTGFTKLADTPVPKINSVDNTAGNANSGDVKKSTDPEKAQTSVGMSGNLSWQLGLSANIGEVVQKGRNPNLFYGGMVTAGLWHKRLKAGIETGIGWGASNDFGSVSNNVRITDSIGADTMPRVTYTDTTRISAYKYRYQYFQVPLFMSKQVMAKGKFALDIKTGPVIGFLIVQQQKNDYASGPQNGAILDTANIDYTRLKISWQWDVMVQFRWNFNDRFSVTLSPSAIFYLNDLYESKNKPAGMPFGIGANAGLIYKFK